MSETTPHSGGDQDGSNDIAANQVRNSAELYDIGRQLSKAMLARLASPDAVTIKYDVKGPPAMIVQRAGAEWERIIVLETNDTGFNGRGKYGIAIHMLHNSPAQDNARTTNSAWLESDQLRMVILEKTTGALVEIKLTPGLDVTADMKDPYEVEFDSTSSRHSRTALWQHGHTFTQKPSKETSSHVPTKEELEIYVSMVQAGQESYNSHTDTSVMPLTLAIMQDPHYYNGVQIVESTADPFFQSLPLKPPPASM